LGFFILAILFIFGVFSLDFLMPSTAPCFGGLQQVPFSHFQLNTFELNGKMKLG